MIIRDIIRYFTNKIINQTIPPFEIIANINIAGGAPRFNEERFYLTSVFNNRVLVNTRLRLTQPPLFVCDPTILNVRVLSQDPNINKSFIVHGFIATASNTAARKAIGFSAIPVSQRGPSCSDNGITWIKSNDF